MALTEYPVPTARALPAGITVGPDGAIWFTEENANQIGRITTSGHVTEYPIPTAFSTPTEIVAGPDGALWFTEFGASPNAKIGRITTSGVVTAEYVLPEGSGPDGITVGPDGAIWFTHNGRNKIGRLTVDADPTSCITPGDARCQEFDVAAGGFRPGDIVPGPDGRLWFTMSEAHKIGAITTDGVPSDYQLAPGADPSGIAASGGALWFTQHGLASIGRIPTFGLPITEFGPTGAGPSGIALGPDNALWFTEKDVGRIGRMTTTGRITEFPLTAAGSHPGGIVAGPDGAMWFTEEDPDFGNKIGRIEAGSSTALPPQPARLPVTGTSATATAKKKGAAKKRCRVPRLRGLTLRKARRKLRRAGCRYRLRGRGRIVSSRPRAGVRTRSTVQVRARPKR